MIMADSNIRSLEEPSQHHWQGPFPTQHHHYTVAFGFLLAVISVLFALFAIAYHMRMMLGDWIVLPDPWQLWPNTAMLLISSIAFEVAKRALAAQQFNRCRRAWFVGQFCAWSFLCGQLWVWQLLKAQGYYLASNPANSFFYLLTGLHGVHLLVGLALWFSSMGLLQGDGKTAQTQGAQYHRFGLYTIYWHYLFVIWLGIFLLLLTS
jgi:cytochrome c oxidase subunit 3